MSSTPDGLKTPSGIGSDVVCGNCFHDLDKVLRCGACKAIAYCNRACQRAHWKIHKTVCQMTPTSTIQLDAANPTMEFAMAYETQFWAGMNELAEHKDSSNMVLSLRAEDGTTELIPASELLEPHKQMFDTRPTCTVGIQVQKVDGTLWFSLTGLKTKKGTPSHTTLGLTDEEKNELKAFPVGYRFTSRLPIHRLRLRQAIGAKMTGYMYATDRDMSVDVKQVYRRYPVYKFYAKRDQPWTSRLRVFGVMKHSTGEYHMHTISGHKRVSVEVIDGLGLDQLVQLDDWTDAQHEAIAASVETNRSLFLDPLGVFMIQSQDPRFAAGNAHPPNNNVRPVCRGPACM